MILEQSLSSSNP